MSLYQCENCGCMENTALGLYACRNMKDMYNWTGKEHLQGKKLCCVCAPTHYLGGTATKYGKWHNQFSRVFLPKGKFWTNGKGNLEHIETKSERYRDYALEQEEGT